MCEYCDCWLRKIHNYFNAVLITFIILLQTPKFCYKRNFIFDYLPMLHLGNVYFLDHKIDPDHLSFLVTSRPSCRLSPDSNKPPFRPCSILCGHKILASLLGRAEITSDTQPFRCGPAASRYTAPQATVGAVFHLAARRGKWSEPGVSAVGAVVAWRV